MADRTVTYFWDVQAWRASRSVQRMTWACRGMYREMLDEQRDKGSLPDCPRACADLLGGPVEQWIECWPMLRRNFVDRRHTARHGDLQVHDPSDHDPKRRIVNLKMARTMREQRAYYRERAKSGQKGGLAKARKRRHLQAGGATPDLEHSSSKPLANPSDKKREEEKRVDLSREERERVPPVSVSPAALPKANGSTVLSPEDALARRAGDFVERYKALYPKYRKGAFYVGKPNLDYLEAVELARVWDDERLDKIATVFLTTDHRFAEEGSRTIAQLRALASWCDGKLREAGL